MGAINLGSGGAELLHPVRQPAARRRVFGEAGCINVYWAGWAGEDRIVAGGFAPGRVSGRLWVRDLSGGSPRSLTAEQTGLGATSPDGWWIFTVGHDGHFLVGGLR